MPKAWDEDEKVVVKGALIDAGRKLFDKYGLQKTTVDEITKAAGISKGAFYLFYKSKEELYFAILEGVESEFREEVYHTLTEPGPSRRESFRLFLEKTTNFLLTLPFYSQMDGATVQYLMRKLSPEVIQEHMQRDRSYFAEHLGRWVENGWMRNVDVDALLGVLISLVYFVVHREDFENPSFEASRRLLLDMITGYLIPEE